MPCVRCSGCCSTAGMSQPVCRNARGQLPVSPVLICRSSSALTGSMAPAKLLHLHPPLMAVLAGGGISDDCCCGRHLACLYWYAPARMPFPCAAGLGWVCAAKGLRQTTDCMAPTYPVATCCPPHCCRTRARRSALGNTAASSRAILQRICVHAHCTTSGHWYGHGEIKTQIG